MESQGGAEAENGVGGGSSGGNSSASGSRWNPTKEQISMLENLYKQGIRTPSAEKIEQITARLRAYGQIEGKNVFYWFQNHKARQRQRQRQRQKQERTTNAYFNPFVNTSQYPAALSSPLCQNVIYTPPYWLPQSDFGFYTQHQNAIVPGPISPRTEITVGPMMMMPRMCDGPPIYNPLQQKIPDYGFCNSNRKTLDLFPQHPTGTLEGDTTDHVVSADCSIDTSSASSIVIDECGRSGNQPYFDFFTSRQESRLND